VLRQQAAPPEPAALLALLAEQRAMRRLLQAVLWAAAGFVLGILLTRAAGPWWG
jgi:hypothetical protein